MPPAALEFGGIWIIQIERIGLAVEKRSGTGQKK
jgi:hypothetical protein